MWLGRGPARALLARGQNKFGVCVCVCACGSWLFLRSGGLELGMLLALVRWVCVCWVGCLFVCLFRCVFVCLFVCLSVGLFVCRVHL